MGTLKPKMRKRLIRFGHAVRVVALFDGRAVAVAGGKEFAGQALRHRLLATRPAIRNQPADGKRRPAIRANFGGNLVRRSTDAAGAYFDERRGIRHRLFEDFETGLAALLLNDIEGVIHDTLGNRLFSAQHKGIDELRYQRIAEFRIGNAGPALRGMFSHCLFVF